MVLYKVEDVLINFKSFLFFYLIPYTCLLQYVWTMGMSTSCFLLKLKYYFLYLTMLIRFTKNAISKREFDDLSNGAVIIPDLLQEINDYSC